MYVRENQQLKSKSKSTSKFKSSSNVNGNANCNANIISDTYTFEINGCSSLRCLKPSEILESDEFRSCGNIWKIHFYPKGNSEYNSDNESDCYVSCHLVNMSNREVTFGYKFSLLNQRTRKLERTWEDPEGMITFGAFGSGYENWGTDDLFLQSIIHRDSDVNCDYIQNDRMMIVAEVFGMIDLNRNRLREAINESADTDTLMRLADSEFEHIKGALTIVNEASLLTKNRYQQNNLVDFRIMKQNDIGNTLRSRGYYMNQQNKDTNNKLGSTRYLK